MKRPEKSEGPHERPGDAESPADADLARLRDDAGAAVRDRSKGLPRLLRVDAAAALLGISRSTFFRLDRKELIPGPVYLGTMRLWSLVELRRWSARGCPPRHVWEESKS
jgi:predicted DNA-binding transcriptional regulator AlpA